MFSSCRKRHQQFKLGKLSAKQWQLVATARAQVAGTIQHTDGQRYIGLDGALALLDGTQVRTLDAGAGISCLGENDTHTYACVQDGLHELANGAVGAQLFLLRDLLPPELDDLPADSSSRCDLQWQHLVFDLLSLGISVAGADTSMAAARRDVPALRVAALRAR